MKELLAALCLVAVLEGLLLFAVPRFWRHAMAEMTHWHPARLRRVGAVLLLIGLAALYLVKTSS
ncbi:DUF2065 domain-containing protein [Arenimonas composti]|uniref:DUF2065 domain-containing protein n=1 Tax=Arenimonas composti TR7-09 = DSM 18010 TaxID=1121013 RepID=A0A091BCB7_9GAMM|nr:DUF2065 domain-containing protein [Arenimonas composti]KFN50318.1 hypothetical protein P873_06480 [Arenimonas composti TR7-09 = DSM 18010]